MVKRVKHAGLSTWPRDLPVFRTSGEGAMSSIVPTWALLVKKSLLQVMELQDQLDRCAKSWTEVPPCKAS